MPEQIFIKTKDGYKIHKDDYINKIINNYNMNKTKIIKYTKRKISNKERKKKKKKKKFKKKKKKKILKKKKKKKKTWKKKKKKKKQKKKKKKKKKVKPFKEKINKNVLIK